jgi:Glycosyl transferases group 1
VHAQTHQPRASRVGTVAFVIEDLPTHGSAGHRTYNRAFVQALRTGGWDVHLLVTGPRLPALVFDAEALLSIPGVHIHFLAARTFLGRRWTTDPRAATRAMFRALSDSRHPWLAALMAAVRGRRATAGTSRAIGRLADARDARWVVRLLGRIRPDAVLVDTIFRSAALPRAAMPFGRVLVAQDVFFRRCESMAAHGMTARPFVTAALERELLSGFNQIVAISDTDAADLRALAPSVPVTTLLCPIQVELATPAPAEYPGRILYLGSAGHHNVDGLRWFLADMWPRIVEMRPELMLDVVGAIGATIGGVPANVKVHGTVADITPIASRALFAINPIRAGSGLKIKMLDYFAYGLPCVTTTTGAEGFPKSPDWPMSICDSSDEIISCVVAWAADRTRIEQLRASAHRYVTQFSITSFERELDGVIRASSRP